MRFRKCLCSQRRSYISGQTGRAGISEVKDYILLENSVLERLSNMEPTKDLTLEGLTARIAESTKTISECLYQNNLPKLSLDSSAPAEFSIPPTFPAVHVARLALLEATK